MGINRKLVLFCSLCLLLGCKTVERDPYAAYNQDGRKAKNIILMIGDGMGLSQLSLLYYENKRQMALEAFPIVGFQKTTAYDDLVTDSAAGATAFACGVKTYRGAIGLNPDSTACKSILEEAEERGLATGLVATSTIVHATPAAFFAHQKYRVQNEAIATHVMNYDIDLLIGGGKKYFTDRDSDGRNLAEELKDRGYQVFDYKMLPLKEMAYMTNRNLVYFSAEAHPVSATMGRDYLPHASRMAPAFLNKRSDKGFFLMIEGSQIDWAGHANDTPWAINELNDFNKAIIEVLKFAQRRDDTLVIVTADHETGGMALNKTEDPDRSDVHYTTNNHTAALIPVFAYGPGAHLFSGVYDNTEINAKMREILGFAEPSSASAY